METKLFDIEGNRVILTEAGCEASTPDLRVALREAGVKPPRKQVLWRARTITGFFVFDFRKRDGRLKRKLPYGYVRLTDPERLMPADELAELMCITKQTAVKAQERGWFEVHPSQSLSEFAIARIVGVGEPLPEELQVGND